MCSQDPLDAATYLTMEYPQQQYCQHCRQFHTTCPVDQTQHLLSQQFQEKATTQVPVPDFQQQENTLPKAA